MLRKSKIIDSDPNSIYGASKKLATIAVRNMKNISDNPDMQLGLDQLPASTMSAQLPANNMMSSMSNNVISSFEPNNVSKFKPSKNVSFFPTQSNRTISNNYSSDVDSFLSMISDANSNLENLDLLLDSHFEPDQRENIKNNENLNKIKAKENEEIRQEHIKREQFEQFLRQKQKGEDELNKKQKLQELKQQVKDHYDLLDKMQQQEKNNNNAILDNKNMEYLIKYGWSPEQDKEYVKEFLNINGVVPENVAAAYRLKFIFNMDKNASTNEINKTLLNNYKKYKKMHPDRKNVDFIDDLTRAYMEKMDDFRNLRNAEETKVHVPLEERLSNLGNENKITDKTFSKEDERKEA